VGKISRVGSRLTKRHTLDVHFLSDQLCRILYRGLVLPEADVWQHKQEGQFDVLHEASFLGDYDEKTLGFS
jgi:hypothetical protein